MADESAPNFYVPGPLSPDDLAGVLRTAHMLARTDIRHDVFSLLDVLVHDHYRDLGRDGCYQVARAVMRFLTGVGALETREPVRAWHLWHMRNREPELSGKTLERALAQTVRQFDPTVVCEPLSTRPE
jgi:hypothetical protein